VIPELNSATKLIQRHQGGSPLQTKYYTGLDVHKRTISYCVRDSGRTIQAEGTIPATGADLDRWIKAVLQPWTAAMGATVFTEWIYDHLQPRAAALKVAHPLMLRAMRQRKTRTIGWTRRGFATVCGAIFCRSVTWPRRRFVSVGVRCDTATCWCGRWCRNNKTSTLLM